MTLLPTAIWCVLLGIAFALLAMAEDRRGGKPTWLFTMAAVCGVSGTVMAAIHFGLT